ncbi:methyl-accepting chemotaxis protein [Rhodobacter ferrooxidans]|uniref:Methyl-accepting chemotaxis sensory transducer n=1 Tax=Rhodobacter ferrooxidans TaxID=371731 RepID=C8RZ31_9RHOB|nr:HAMP domain-containing methyl-accepting chemotaxis protein [Rhodobacter sp. SW2]EEW25988.1 methyl-accepting chemotaxis sensory transducer [Rhodobacter sp. SW2]
MFSRLFKKLIPRRTSVFLRALLIMVVTSGIVTAVLSWNAATLTSRVATDGLVRLADEVTQSLAAGTTAAIKFRKGDDIAHEVAAALQRTEGAAELAVAFDAKGAVITAVPPDRAADAGLLSGLISQALADGTAINSADGLQRIELARSGDGKALGGIAILWSDASLQAAISAATWRSRGIALAIFVALAILAALALRAIIVLPLRRVDRAMASVADAHFDTRVPETARGDEIGELARNLDHMRESLGAASEAEACQHRAADEQARVIEVLRGTIAALAEGRLNCRIDDVFPAEYEPLRIDLNQMLETLSGTLSEVVAAAERIRSGADSISQSADDLSHRTENQAATLEQSVAAVEQLSQSVRSVADDTRKVAVIVQRTRSETESSYAIVQEAVVAMSDIRKSSDQISHIISVIDDIAFQTNLLALNAGVEAARAGDAGRGFAVVASEVRALAQRTSDSAREIKTLIQSSATQVLNGVNLVDRTGEALTSITREFAGVADLAGGIATAISNQSTSLGEVSLGMVQLDQVTQQNAGMVEQATVQHHAIRQDAEHLAEMVARFKLGNSMPASVTALPQQMAEFRARPRQLYGLAS